MDNVTFSKLSTAEMQDKYQKLNEDFLALKRYTRQQEDKITKLQTKHRKLITDCNKEISKNDSEAFRMSNIKLEDKNHYLQQLVSQLQYKNNKLEAQLKVASVQLSSIRQHKFKNVFYNHIASRIDTGLRNPLRRTKSLTNIANKPSVNNKVRSASAIRQPIVENSDESRSASPSNNKKEGLPNHIKSVLEEARNRIVILSEEQEQLIEKLFETQQKCEEVEEDLRERIKYLENELCKANELTNKRKLKDEKDISSVIQIERESQLVNSRFIALQKQLVDTEVKLNRERKLRDELMDAIAKLKLENYGSESKLKESQLNCEKLNYCNKEFKERNLYLQKQFSQLELENEHLMKMSVDNTRVQNQDTSYLTHLKDEMEILKSMLEVERNEKQTIYGELMQQREKIILKESELKHLRISLLEATTQLNKITKDGIYEPTDVNKLIDSYKKISSEKSKVNGIEKLAFDELEKKFKELQWLYREKKVELEKMSSVFNDHTDTFKQIEKEKESLNFEYCRSKKELVDKIEELEMGIKQKDEEYLKLNQHLILLTSKTVKTNHSEIPRKEENIANTEPKHREQNVLQTFSYGKHYNVLEFSLFKVSFSVHNFDLVKSFVSWVMPFEMIDPLQHTNLAIGSEAIYRHSTLYKFKMNLENCLLLQEGKVLLSVFILLNNGHPVRVGEGQILLKEVMQQSPVYRDVVPILSAIEDIELLEIGSELPMIVKYIESLPPGDTIGNLHFEMRFLRSGKSERREISKFFTSETSNKEIKFVENMFRPLSASIKKQASVYEDNDDDDNESKSGNEITRTETDSHELVKSNDLKKYQDRSNESDIHSSENTASNSKDSESPLKELIIFKKEENKPKPKSLNKTHSKSSYISELQEKRKVIKIKSLVNLFREKREIGSKSSGQDQNDVIMNNKISLVKNDVTTPKSKNSLSDNLRKAFKGSKSNSTREEIVMTSPEKREKKLSMVNKIVNMKNEIKSDHAASKVEEDDIDEVESNVDTYLQEAQYTGSSSDLSSSDNESTSTDRPSNKEILEDTPSHNEEHGTKNGHVKERNGSSESGTDDLKPDSLSKDSRERICVKDVASTIQTSSACLPKADCGYEVSSVSETSCTKETKETSESDSSGSLESFDGINFVTVDVVGVKLFKNTRVMKDSAIKYLFVDYHGFLGLEPSLVETPQSIPKPSTEKTIFFNFKNTVDINKEKYPLRWEAFQKLYRGGGLIKFTLTSEPPPELQKEEDCKELGYSYVDLRKLVSEREDKSFGECCINDKENGECIGTLLLSISMANDVRQQ